MYTESGDVMEKRVIHEFETMASKFEIIEFPDSVEIQMKAHVDEPVSTVFVTGRDNIKLDIITDNNIIGLTFPTDGFLKELERAIRWYKKRQKEE